MQVSPGCAKMAQQIQETFPGAAWTLDVLTRELTISVAINNDLLLGVSLPYNFPANPPMVTLLNANGRYLAGLEVMGSCGLLDPVTGRISYQECFTWTPAMTGPTLLYLIAVIIKTAEKTAEQKPSTQEPATVQTHDEFAVSNGGA